MVSTAATARRVFAWITDTAGCFHYRILTPLTHLPRDRWEVAWGAPPAGGPAELADRYDVVVGQRLAGPQPDWLALCARSDVLTVYDYDDDLLDLDPENTVPYGIYAPLRGDTERNMAAAAVVTVCVPHLVDKVRRINPNVQVLPICVPPEIVYWPVRRGPAALTVGWAGSMFHHQDWTTMPAHLAEYAGRVPHASFHMIGADYTRGLLGGRCRFTGWGTVDQYYRALDFDIGVAPADAALRSSRTRSHTKLLEYAARGIPCVAQACGQYLDWVDDGVNGFLVGHDREWPDLLTALSDDQVRGPMSRAARVQARLFGVDRHIGSWERVYSGQAAWPTPDRQVLRTYLAGVRGGTVDDPHLHVDASSGEVDVRPDPVKATGFHPARHQQPSQPSQ